MLVYILKILFKIIYHQNRKLFFQNCVAIVVALLLLQVSFLFYLKKSLWNQKYKFKMKSYLFYGLVMVVYKYSKYNYLLNFFIIGIL